MKKLIIISLVILCLPVAGFTQFTHLGISAAYSSQVKEPGIGLNGLFRVNDEIKLTPNIMYYLPHKITTDDGTQEFQWYTINLDGNYIIFDQGIFEGYGVMGLNFSVVQGKQDEVILGETFNDKQTLQKLGLNVGAGMRFNISDKVVPFGELRYTLGSKARFSFNEVSTSQFGIFAGILVRITEDKDRTVSEDY
jgi:hypothetical protein